METRRRKAGFVQAGSIRPDQLGLPRKQGRELLLAVGWRRVAGEAIARQARAVRVYRGTLEVEASDRRWRETLRTLLPTLAGRLAAAVPGLKIRKCRLLGDGGPGAPVWPLPVVSVDQSGAPWNP
jgi:predicted nucleic acid-binding Zn ribbon protein